MVLTVLETPHVVVGAAIAAKVVNPYLAIPLAFASHFVLDMVPHWNPHLNTETKKNGRPTKNSTLFVFADVCLALIAGIFIAAQALPNEAQAITILLASFAAVLPDVIEGPHFFLGIRNKFIEKWIAFQKSIQNDTNIYAGLATQVVTMIVAFWWILN